MLKLKNGILFFCGRYCVTFLQLNWAVIAYILCHTRIVFCFSDSILQLNWAVVAYILWHTRIGVLFLCDSVLEQNWAFYNLQFIAYFSKRIFFLFGRQCSTDSSKACETYAEERSTWGNDSLQRENSYLLSILLCFKWWHFLHYNCLGISDILFTIMPISFILSFSVNKKK